MPTQLKMSYSGSMTVQDPSTKQICSFNYLLKIFSSYIINEKNLFDLVRVDDTADILHHLLIQPKKIYSGSMTKQVPSTPIRSVHLTAFSTICTSRCW
ncbi:hypothetical protein J6590_058588 [Homalodisca vitripennis]|nr:hypothetical protein J6590_058588 [Homalodisca vitripennis]